ncbi:50S ribosomal protein L23 [Candidatus Parcubacteria bacterium]|nr:50S ribosomal protein L23 [Candidatus Parcubacteria bacterium]
MYNQYAFEVKPKANKVQIKKAIETYYNVRPVKVNIINIQGKNVRWGRTRGRTQDSKKAIVTLRQGDKIEVYEGV